MLGATRRYVILICVLFGAASPGFAASYDVSLPAVLYGNLNQHDMTSYPSMACGPASVTNALDYTQNANPTVYGTSLIPTAGYNGLKSVANTLTGSSYMKTDNTNGTWHDNLIIATENYIESRVPGKTTYAAQDSWGWSHQTTVPSWVQITTPTFGFMYDALTAGDAIEILLTYNSGGGHFVTVRGLTWSDLDGDGMIESSENAKMHIVNPWTGLTQDLHIWQSSLGGSINTDYSSSWVSTAFAWTVPEPATFTLLVISGLAMLRRRRK